MTSNREATQNAVNEYWADKMADEMDARMESYNAYYSAEDDDWSSRYDYEEDYVDYSRESLESVQDECDADNRVSMELDEMDVLEATYDSQMAA